MSKDFIIAGIAVAALCYFYKAQQQDAPDGPLVGQQPQPVPKLPATSNSSASNRTVREPIDPLYFNSMARQFNTWQLNAWNNFRAWVWGFPTPGDDLRSHPGVIYVGPDHPQQL